MFGRTDTVGVQLEFGTSVVPVLGTDKDYEQPSDGATVVTIVVDGLLEEEKD